MHLYRFLRPLLFQFDPERVHTATIAAARCVQSIDPGLVSQLFAYEHPVLEQSCLEKTFRNPIGLAAGFDKNARLPRFFERIGFGFTEVGSVTYLPSQGNPRPRAFRLPADRAVINRMGLNNEGAHAITQRLVDSRDQLQRPLGVNIAKTHDPSILGKEGLHDFCSSFKLLAPLADYVALNVSCPNTREGTTFEDPDTFKRLADAVAELRRTMPKQSPILVKLSPPESLPIPGDHPVTEIIRIARDHEFDGFIATNTASDRQRLTTSEGRLREIGDGGLSGRPLQKRSTALVRFVYNQTHGELPIVGVGGIDSADSAYRMIKAGASLVQLYTALVYEGPGLVKRIKRGLVRRIREDGFSSVAEAVGCEARSGALEHP